MKIELEIPNEFIADYQKDKFKDFFSRVLCDIDRKGACGLYEEETAEMFIYAFDKSKSAYDIDNVVEELETYKAKHRGSDGHYISIINNAIEIVKAGYNKISIEHNEKQSVKQKVWIIFGSDARSDGKNIEGVYATEKEAKEALDCLETCCFIKDTYHIEEHDLEGSEFTVEMDDDYDYE